MIEQVLFRFLKIINMNVSKINFIKNTNKETIKSVRLISNKTKYSSKIKIMSYALDTDKTSKEFTD